MRNLATALFEHKKIATTEAKAKELRPFAEALITKAKHALLKEKQGLLPEGQKVDIHNRRIVARLISNKAVLQELFDTIAPMVEERPGGYCRVIKTGFRRGDAGRTAIIELVDWAAPQDGAFSTKAKKKKAQPASIKSDNKATAKTKKVDSKSDKKEIENTIIDSNSEEIKNEIVADNSETQESISNDIQSETSTEENSSKIEDTNQNDKKEETND